MQNNNIDGLANLYFCLSQQSPDNSLRVRLQSFCHLHHKYTNKKFRFDGF